MKSRDRVFVFAEGKQADEARRAGAEFVGGPELIDGVTFFFTHAHEYISENRAGRERQISCDNVLVYTCINSSYYATPGEDSWPQRSYAIRAPRNSNR